MRDCLRQLAPDLMGTQEGVHQQLKDIAADLPDYDWIGTGRDGGDKGEFMSIFFGRDRFEPLTTNHFWLSDTPEVVASSTWGNTCKRMVTWVRFRERSSGREFYFWNTHLDHEVEAARQKSAQLIRERVEALKTDLPLVLTGDFNCTGGNSRAYDILVKEGGFADTWSAAKVRGNESFNSFHGFQVPTKKGNRIDWILTRGTAAVERTEIVTFSKEGRYPSDHFPVATWLSFP
jgi:endonuclease/exonuclease/phosphatase family metal-dependent hydrolase